MASLFTDGDYLPLHVTGRQADHVIAFARRQRGLAAITVALRHFAHLTDGGRTWVNFNTLDATVIIDDFRTRDFERAIPIKELLRSMPGAILDARLIK
jgi:(1->4)-alpha-D-glucan 1-alpha-D-glucosylmutase